MVTFWCACKVDPTGLLLQKDRVVLVKRLSQGVYEAFMENALGDMEGNPVAVPWYVENATPAQALPLMRFLVATDALDATRLVVRGFNAQLQPTDGPFSLLVWRFGP